MNCEVRIMEKRHFLGFDFGASSGRAMLGSFDGERIEIEEIHRFSNDPVMLCGRFVWDLPRLVFEMKQALLKLSKTGVKVSGIGIDTWGVDFGLLDKNGRLLGLPVHYRDARTDGVMDEVFKIIPKKELFERTGTAFNQFNTLYQLYAMKLEGDPTLEMAEKMLFMPDLLAYFLTGEKGVEYTMASTSQLLDPRTRNWSREVFERLGLPEKLAAKIQMPGAMRGTLLPEIARECGVDEIPVYVVGGHDTASAVAAVPAEGGDYAYLSSGTWSLLGVLSKEPKTDEKVMNAEYTNEGAVDGSIRLLKNIMGLWIIQECKREWDRRSDRVDFAELVKMAERAQKFKALIDVDDPCFLAPGDMPARIQDYCRRTGQAVPEGRGEISRVVYEGLALKYRWSIEKLENDILNRKISQLNIVGGGSKNALLNQFTADAIGRDVIAGPSEGTVIGNLLLQAQAVGAMREEDRAKVVARSFPTETFKPENAAEWDAAYEKYLKMF